VTAPPDGRHPHDHRRPHHHPAAVDHRLDVATPADLAARLAQKGDRVRIEGHRETVLLGRRSRPAHASDRFIAHHVRLFAIKPRQQVD